MTARFHVYRIRFPDGTAYIGMTAHGVDHDVEQHQDACWNGWHPELAARFRAGGHEVETLSGHQHIVPAREAKAAAIAAEPAALNLPPGKFLRTLAVDPLRRCHLPQVWKHDGQLVVQSFRQAGPGEVGQVTVEFVERVTP